MSDVDLLDGPVRPRRYAGSGWLWLCWDDLVSVANTPGLGPPALSTSLDGGGSVVPLEALGQMGITNLRIADPPAGAWGLFGQILARGRGRARHGRTLQAQHVEPWESLPPGVAVESSSSEMLLRADPPGAGPAWRVYFQKRWLAIQHLAAGLPGELDAAENLLAGGLDGGALPRLETLPASYAVRAARGFFATESGAVRYRGVQLGPLIYDMTFRVGQAQMELTIHRDALAQCFAFAAPALAFGLVKPEEAALSGELLRLTGQGAAVELQAQTPLRWRLDGPDALLEFDDPPNDLGLIAIPAGQRKGLLHTEFRLT